MTTRAMPRKYLLFFLLCALSISSRAAETTSLPSTGTLRCDYLEFHSTGNALSARGNVVLESSGTRLEADEALIYMEQRRAVLTGHVYLSDGTMAMLSGKADYHWEAASGTIKNGYVLDPP